MRLLRNKFDKKLLSELPRATFEGRIVVVQSEQEAQKAVDYLLKQPLLGFDTETRPTFRPGPMRPVSLLQVSAEDVCFLFRLCMIDLPDCLLPLFAQQGITKIALSWADDTGQLRHRRHDIEMNGFIELQQYVRFFGIEDASLQKIYANLFGEKISKCQQLSNWETDVLSEAQKLYAATDAWACIRIYKELEQLKRANDWQLIKDDEETISQ